MFSLIEQWKRRILTPICRNTVVKSLIVPKLNHFFMFISLPNLKKENCYMKLTKKLVWIYLEITMQQSKERNCLSMVNITDFIASLKCIKKLTQCHMSYGKVFVMQTMATLLLNKRFKGLKRSPAYQRLYTDFEFLSEGPIFAYQLHYHRINKNQQWHISCPIIE